ncbi:C-C motif chemokine 22-like isoform X1 [Sinocyclocheilus anshuiensis]|uniref:C-C motif chemokine 22-like isoform X1 n=1 Tax=Sinocyclocheilus anshuiensis TaxID=1608454 RepID=UPI0007B790D5|nr:PREDICTED: C-C motif chemokine 22-like isoform X1 [Sinocyclocheilus anshuiensis]
MIERHDSAVSSVATFMKTSLLFLTLCCALQFNTSDGSTASDIENSICCFNPRNIRIPLQRLEYYYWTSDICPLRHIVFVTAPEDPSTPKKQFCMDPENKWVQRAINHLDKKHAKNLN